MGEAQRNDPSGAAAPAQRWCWHATLASFDAGTVSILAATEFLMAVGLLIWLLIDRRLIEVWLVASLTAVALLLRTPLSVDRGVRWMEFATKLVQRTNRWLVRHMKAGGLLRILVQSWLIFPSCLLVTLSAIVIRVAATALSALQQPLRTLQAIPGNWFRQTFCIDASTIPELVPGHDDGGLERPLTFSLGLVELRSADLLQRLLMGQVLTIIFGPAFIYRLSFKLTGIVWLPLLWVVSPLQPGSHTPREKLEDLRYGIVTKLALAWSVIVVAAFLIKIHLDAGLSFLPPVLNRELVLTTYPWHIAAAVNGLVAIALFLFADRQLVQLSRNKGLSAPVLEAAITSTLMFRRVIGLYTLANALWLVAVEAKLVERMHFVWKPFHWW